MRFCLTRKKGQTMIGMAKRVPSFQMGRGQLATLGSSILIMDSLSLMLKMFSKTSSEAETPLQTLWTMITTYLGETFLEIIMVKTCKECKARICRE
jgi:hypothetical protein